MSKINPDAQAFPIPAGFSAPNASSNYSNAQRPGISIRAHIAITAMNGFIASGVRHKEDVARISVQMADALITELNK